MILNTTLPELVYKVEKARETPTDSQLSGAPFDLGSLPSPSSGYPLGGKMTQSTFGAIGSGIQKDCLKGFRKISNLIKESLVKNYSDQTKTILDIGAGKGGDLPKYRKYGVKEILAVEPSQTNIDEFKIRLNETYTELIKKVKLLNAKGEERDRIQSFINKTKIDIIFMFYSMSFFFKDKETLQNLIDLVVSNLDENKAVFAGTMMEGSLLQNKLLEQKQIKKECYDINLVEFEKYNSDGTPKIFNQQITIDYKGTETATFQTEYLSYYQELERLLIQYDFIGQYNLSYNFYEKQKTVQLDTEEKQLIQNYIDFSFVKNKSVYKSIYKGKDFQLYPVKSKGYEFWFRTSAIDDGSCFFHSVLMSLLGNDYRKEYVYNLRQKIAQDFELESYINLQEGQNAIIEFELLLAEKVNIECFDKCPFDTNLDLKNFIEKKLEYFHQNYQNVTNVYKLIDYLVDEMIKENFDSEEARLILNAHVYHNFDLFLKSIESYDVWAEFWMVIYLQQYLKNQVN